MTLALEIVLGAIVFSVLVAIGYREYKHYKNTIINEESRYESMDVKKDD